MSLAGLRVSTIHKDNIKSFYLMVWNLYHTWGEFWVRLKEWCAYTVVTSLMHVHATEVSICVFCRLKIKVWLHIKGGKYRGDKREGQGIRVTVVTAQHSFRRRAPGYSNAQMSLCRGVVYGSSWSIFPSKDLIIGRACGFLCSRRWPFSSDVQQDSEWGPWGEVWWSQRLWEKALCDYGCVWHQKWHWES